MFEVCVLYQDSLNCGCMILNPRTVNLALHTSFCSLRDNGLTPSGAMVLARALQHNKSLKELKWVVYVKSYKLRQTYYSVFFFFWNDFISEKRKGYTKGISIWKCSPISFYQELKCVEFSSFLVSCSSEKGHGLLLIYCISSKKCCPWIDTTLK